MKSLIYVIVISTFGFIACTDNAINPVENTIVGQWDQYETSFSIGGPELQNRKVKNFRIFTFQESGDMSMWLEGATFTGSWSTEGNRLSLTFDTQENFADMYSYEFKSNGDLQLNNMGCIEPCIDSFERK